MRQMKIGSSRRKKPGRVPIPPQFKGVKNYASKGHTYNKITGSVKVCENCGLKVESYSCNRRIITRNGLTYDLIPKCINSNELQGK